MKIGILTLVRSINDGAVLQAIALQRLLQAHLPSADIEIVDFQTASIEKQERRNLWRRRPPFIYFSARQKRRSVQHFLRKEARLSAESLISDDLRDAQHFLNAQQYDHIVVGSDVVWQTRPGSLPLPPNIFFLPGIASKKYAFAASADRSDRTLWPQGQPAAHLADLLADFSFISVRDQTTKAYLTQLGVAEDVAHYMPDPTLQYDITQFAELPTGIKAAGQPLAGVAVSGMRLRQQLTDQLHTLGFQVINLLGTTLDGQRNAPQATLAQRLGVYALLDFMVTDRFHGSIFTLKLAGCPTIFVEPIAKYPHADSKGRDLFGRIGIADFVWRYDPDDEQAKSLQAYLSAWEANPPPIAHNLAQLAASAQPKVSKLIDLLAG